MKTNLKSVVIVKYFFIKRLWINKKKEDFVLIKKRKFLEIDNDEDLSLNDEINIVYRKTSILNGFTTFCKDKLKLLISKENKYLEELYKKFKIENNKNDNKMC